MILTLPNYDKIFTFQSHPILSLLHLHGRRNKEIALNPLYLRISKNNSTQRIYEYKPRLSYLAKLNIATSIMDSLKHRIVVSFALNCSVGARSEQERGIPVEIFLNRRRVRRMENYPWKAGWNPPSSIIFLSFSATIVRIQRRTCPDCLLPSRFRPGQPTAGERPVSLFLSGQSVGFHRFRVCTWARRSIFQAVAHEKRSSWGRVPLWHGRRWPAGVTSVRLHRT